MPTKRAKRRLIAWIRERVQEGEYLIKIHGRQRMSERGIWVVDVENALLTGRVIEDYPFDPRGHSCLVLGEDQAGYWLHVVCNVSTDILAIVTAYYPEEHQWSNYEVRMGEE